jgi:hypothetical protein
MRNLLTVIVSIVALFLAATSAAHARPTAHPAGCAKVRIGDSETCLIAGRPCTPRYEKLYRKHGFKCRRNTAGEYRLWQVPLHGLPPAV